MQVDQYTDRQAVCNVYSGNAGIVKTARGCNLLGASLNHNIILVGIKNRELDPVRKEVALICGLSLKVIIHC